MKKLILLGTCAVLIISSLTCFAPVEARTTVYRTNNRTYVIKNGRRYYRAPNGTYYRGPYRTYVTRNGRQYYSYRRTNGTLVTRRVY